MRIQLPGERLVTRMWDTLAANGIGALFRPWQIRREGRAFAEVRADEIRMLAQAERDREDILAGRKQLVAGQLVAIEPPEFDLSITAPDNTALMAQHLRQQVLADTFRREVNVAKAALAAEEELANDPQDPPERTPDPDWLFRWRDYAGEVSVPDLQSLWGKVLAGEVKSPGSCSLRTLDFLRSLSTAEANQIAQLSPFVVGDFVYRADDVLDEEGLSFAHRLAMQQLGILSGVEALGGLVLTFERDAHVKGAGFTKLLVSHNKALLVTASDPAKKLAVPIYQVTPIGKELLRLGTLAPNERHVRALAEAICKQGFTVRLADWTWLGEGKGRYSNAQVVCDGAVTSAGAS